MVVITTPIANHSISKEKPAVAMSASGQGGGNGTTEPAQRRLWGKGCHRRGSRQSAVARVCMAGKDGGIRNAEVHQQRRGWARQGDSARRKTYLRPAAYAAATINDKSEAIAD